VRVLGLSEEDAKATGAYRLHQQEEPEEAAFLFKARVLSYSVHTWTKHAAALKEFVLFCNIRELNIFECTPSVVNLFMLYLAQKGRTFGVIESSLHALSFVYRFFLMPNILDDKSVADTKKFVEKVCPHVQNKKLPFGSAEVRAIFDHLLKKFGSLEKVPAAEFRTFCLAVFQHKSFCRFSDASTIKISDILFETDYFKIRISRSKTDQGGRGEWVFVPKNPHGFLDPHMLLCIYLHKMGFDNCPGEVYLFPPLA